MRDKVRGHLDAILFVYVLSSAYLPHPLNMDTAEEESKKRLEFRKMLLKVSEGLSSEDLDNLKHLLRGEIVQVKLDSCKRGIDIFESLEEKSNLILWLRLFLISIT